MFASAHSVPGKERHSQGQWKQTDALDYTLLTHTGEIASHPCRDSFCSGTSDPPDAAKSAYSNAFDNGRMLRRALPAASAPRSVPGFVPIIAQRLLVQKKRCGILTRDCPRWGGTNN
jgi:hypothetical protein